MKPAYEYSAVVTRVIDGDTVVADIDLGFGVWLKEQRLRLTGINAPELFAIGGKEAKSGLRGILDELAPFHQATDAASGNWKVMIRTEKAKKEKYGRWLATILSGSEPMRVVNDLMVERGFAARYDGHGA